MKACRYCGYMGPRHSDQDCPASFPGPFERILWALLALIVGFLVGSMITAAL